METYQKATTYQVGQQNIEFDRVSCDALLKYRIKLPTSPWRDGDTRNRVKGETLRLILLAIYDCSHSGARESYPSYEAIAHKSGCTRPTAKRGVAALRRMGLLEIQARGCGSTRSSNRYIINWTQLGQYDSEKAPLFTAPHPAHGAPHPAHGAPTPAHGAPTPAHGAPLILELPSQSISKTPPPPPESADWLAAAALWKKSRISIAADLAAEYQAAGRAPADLQHDIDEALATAELAPNLRLWTKGPESAAAWYLRTGTWPATGVVTLAEHEQRQAAANAAQAEAEHEARELAERELAANAAADAREAEYGPLLHAMTDNEREQLVNRMADAGRQAMARRSLRMGTWAAPGLYRDIMLAEIAAAGSLEKLPA